MIENEQARIADMAHSLPGEEWRPVLGYENTYAVSSRGRVYSNPRPTTPGGILKGSLDNYGYRRVALVQNGKQRTRRIHILVMQAFVGPHPEGMEIRHLDGDKLNARLDNLAYGTHAENMLDIVTHGSTQTRQTHCKRGHEFTPENIQWCGPDHRRRRCRTCRNERRRVA